MNGPCPALCFDAQLELATPWGRAAGEITIDGQRVSADWRQDGDGQWVGEHGNWHLTCVGMPRGAFSLRLRNQGDKVISLRSVAMAQWNPEAFSPALDTAMFRELIHASSFAGDASGVKGVGRRGAGQEFQAVGSMLTVYQHEDGEALLLGILPPMGQGYSEFHDLHDQPHLEGSFGCEVRHVFRCTVDPGAEVSTSPLLGLAGTDGTRLMQAYADQWALLLDGPAKRPPMVGWNSWDHYSGAVTRQDMDDNLAAGRELFGEALQLICIDEGWEQQWGIWEPNAKFDGNLTSFCTHVREQGCVPGVWTAPLLVNTYTPLYLKHPEWFALRADGQVQTDTYSYGPMAYLDVTVPEVIEWVEAQFGRLKQAGFGYFKVDFCQCILGAECFRDASVGRAELIRRAFQAVRRAIGEEPYLLSCGSPYESVVGLVDGVRSTGDIHIYWGHVLSGARSLAAHWWMHGALWNCDPDFLVVRGPDTAEPPYGRRQVVTPVGPSGGWISGRPFNETEARTWALLVHLSGGDVVLGDSLPRLHPQAVAMIQRVLRPRQRAAVPVDLFVSEQDLPRVWISRGDEDTVVGLFNWSDHSARLDFDPAEYGLEGEALDFWTDEPVAAVPARMPRRSSLALCYTT